MEITVVYCLNYNDLADIRTKDYTHVSAMASFMLRQAKFSLTCTD